LVNMQKLSESGAQQVSPPILEHNIKSLEKLKNSKFLVDSPKYQENRTKNLQNNLLNISVSPPNNETENIPFYLGSGNSPAVFEETTPTHNSYLPMSSALSQAYRKRDQPYPRNLSNINNNEYIMNTTADIHADIHGRHQHSVSYRPYNNRIFGGIAFQKQKSCFTNFQNASAKKERLISVTKVKSLRRIKSLEFLISKNTKKRVENEKFDQNSNENLDSQGKFRTAHRAPDANFKALFFPREKWNATSNWVSQARNETKKIVNGVSNDDVFSDDLRIKSSSCKELHSLKFNKTEQHKVLTDNSGRSLVNGGGGSVVMGSAGSTMGQIKHFHRPIDEAGRVSFRDSFCGISGRRRMHSENAARSSKSGAVNFGMISNYGMSNFGSTYERQSHPMDFNDPIDFGNYKINGPVVPVDLDEVKNEFEYDDFNDDTFTQSIPVETQEEEEEPADEQCH